MLSNVSIIPGLFLSFPEYLLHHFHLHHTFEKPTSAFLQAFRLMLHQSPKEIPIFLTKTHP